jgi:TPR repeat protein
MPQIHTPGLDLAPLPALIGNMKFLTVFSVSAALAASALSSVAMAQEDEAEAPLFPQELILLPQDVQSAAIDGLEAEDVEIPDGMSASDEAWYRAQIAYVGEDWTSARTYAETAAVAGHVEAAMLAGLIARNGLTGPADFAAATQWFRRAAEQDQPTALYQLGLLARLDQDGLGLGQPRNWFERAARLGHVSAMIAFATEQRNSPVPQDALEAREWFERAAQQGASEGMYQFAQMLDEGVGGTVDATGALVWYERAAAVGHAEAAFQGGMILSGADASDDDLARAMQLMRIAAETGYSPAMGRLGLLFFRTDPQGEDRTEAANWIGQGARTGDTDSQFVYAVMLSDGVGVDVDLEESYFWVLVAAHDGYGLPVTNPRRDELQVILERHLPLDIQAQVRVRVDEEVNALR